MKNISEKSSYKISIIGLGYVGLPLLIRFALKGFSVIGYDNNEERVKQLKSLEDINNEIDTESLKILQKKTNITSNVADLKDSNVYIITVPTPINQDNTPDLLPIINSSELVGTLLKKDELVIYESTVYPGVTDEVCTPILEKISSLIINKDFITGYSPERIVPGDKVNTLEKIKKIVSGSNIDALNRVSFLYSSIIDAGIHKAPTIKVAEAAKVTENIQRDVNIALINEMHQLYTSIGINTHDVIEAASTKWNFMKLSPGLVGGHCISIDPYYLMHKSEMSGYKPNIMRASRKLNDEMPIWVIDNFLNFVDKKNINLKKIKITMLGYTFKENCSDTRNTKVKDLILSIKKMGFELNLWDPLLSDDDIDNLSKLDIEICIEKPKNVELAFVCVYHDEILEFLNEYKGYKYDYRKPYF